MFTLSVAVVGDNTPQACVRYHHQLVASSTYFVVATAKSTAQVGWLVSCVRLAQVVNVAVVLDSLSTSVFHGLKVISSLAFEAIIQSGFAVLSLAPIPNHPPQDVITLSIPA